MSKVVCSTALTLLICLSIPASAQVNATLGGTVADSTGALIPGVDVTARNVNTGIATTRITNESGNYEFPSLQPGIYSLSASLPGFQTAVYNNVQLSQAQQIRLNFTLQIGALTNTVEVVAETDTRLASTSASVGNVLTDLTVRSLPLSSRNVLDLVRTTTPGAVGDNFGGSRMSQLNTTRDGLPVSDGRYLDWNGAYSATFTSPDLVEEVQVMVNSIDAAVGRGSGQVRMQTRSGTNTFHGAVFYANNNSSLNSQTWFQNLVGAEKSYRNRNQFGGRIGGPIVKNKAFFFVLYDGQRYLEKQDVVASVLTAPARQGIFRYLTENATGANGGTSRRNGNAFSTTPSVTLGGEVLAVSPSNGNPLFLNSFNLFSDVGDPNRTRIDPVWVGPQLLSRMPLPNDWTIGDGLNTAGYRWLRRHPGTDSSTGSDPNVNRDHLSIRADYQISVSNKVSFTLSREKDWGVTDQSGLPDFPDGYFGEVRRFPDVYTVAWTSTISPTVLNEFRWGLRRSSWVGWSPFHMGCCYRGAEEKQISDRSQEAQATFPQVQGNLFFINPTLVGTYAPFSTSTPRDSTSPLSQFANTLSWTKGNHSFQGGFELTLANSDQSNSGAGGVGTTLPFATLGVGNTTVPGINSTNFRGLNANDIGTAENTLAHLAGTIAQINHQFFVNSPEDTRFLDFRDTILRVRDFHQNDWAFFLKDNWKVTTRLTLNLGLRYEKYGVPYDATGLGARPSGGQAGLFGISGRDFSALWNPGAAGGNLTTVELAGKHSPNPNTLVYKDDWNNFAPSVGFSWSLPWFERNTILRGGYGINYTGAATFLQYSSQIGNMPGSTLGVTFAPGTYLDIAGVGAANIIPLPIGGARPFDPVALTNRTTPLEAYTDDRAIPYVQNFNLSLQRELWGSLTLDVGYVGSKGTQLWGPIELNESNIFENGILEAFNITRAGGNAPLFDTIFRGLNVPGAGIVNGTTLTGSQALRRYNTTNQWFANGDVASFANFLNSSQAITGQAGGLLRNGGLPENFIVVNPQFGNVRLHGNIDSSIYHSLQTQITKRMSHGFTGQFSYTWSKNLGNSAAGNANNSDTTATTRDPRNRQLQRGLITFDRPHVIKAHTTWDLPFGPNRPLLDGAGPIIQRFVEGWQVSSIFSWTSGSPLTFTSTRRTLASRANINTADLVGILPSDLGKVQVRDGFVEYFEGLKTLAAPRPDFGTDTSLAGRFTNQVVVDNAGNILLQNPAPGTTGNTAVNLSGIRGPGSLGLDAALSKRVQMTEGTSFTIRADMINILNTPRWGNPNTDINSASFGRITGATGSRTVTINARVDF